ncbi:MAG TPA: XdhC family protein [Acidimicrobiia bacterium]|nr:XdhC family protein [Acidimicrobiia bacterium]
MTSPPPDGWKVLEHAVELSRRGESFVLATVVWRQGPSSGKEGSRAIVSADGSTFGWIGGACAEPAMIREALASLEDGNPRLLVLGMEQLLVDLPEGMISVPISCQSDGALQVHLEPVVPAPMVVVVGRSPMASTLVDFVDRLGWQARLIDRSDPIDVSPGAAIVVATQGHGDEEVLIEAIAKQPGYLGLVASRKRSVVVLDYLRAHGVTDDLLEAIHVPAGIDLGPTSHREMAVSILAELVAARVRGELSSSTAVMDTSRPATAVDPVCGMEVTADESGRPYEYGEITYYFCCPACRNTFVADPEAELRRAHADHE